MAIDLGESYTTSYSSMPVGATDVTVTITLPDGTAGAPVSAPSGSYSYLTTVPGRHQATWQSTTSTGGTDRFSDVFDVSEATSAALVSLADVKAHLNMKRTDDDEELRLFLEAATALVEHEVGPVTGTTHTEIVEAADTIVLAKAPVLSVTSVVQTFPYYGSLPFATPQYLLDGPSGLLRRQPWVIDGGFAVEPFYNLNGLRLTVTYTTGRPSIPAAIRLAALIIIRHLWETQRLAGAKPVAGGEDQQQYGDVEIPSRAYELLAPYRRAPVIS